MITIIKDLIAVAQKYEPDSDIVKAAQLALMTLENPTNPSTMIEDIDFVMKFAKKYQEKFETLHPNAKNILKELL